MSYDLNLLLIIPVLTLVGIVLVKDAKQVKVGFRHRDDHPIWPHHLVGCGPSGASKPPQTRRFTLPESGCGSSH